MLSPCVRASAKGQSTGLVAEASKALESMCPRLMTSWLEPLCPCLMPPGGFNPSECVKRMGLAASGIPVA